MSSSTLAGPSQQRKLQTHNVQHTMRAASKAKAKSNQNQQASQKQTNPQSTNLANADRRSDSASNEKPSTSSTTAASQRKTTFRQVLSSPLTINWPSISAVDAQPILYTLLDVLKDPVLKPFTRTDKVDQREVSKSDKRKRRRAEKEASETDEKREGTNVTAAENQDAVSQMEVDLPVEATEASSSVTPSPITLGINSVSRRMESMIAHRSAVRQQMQTQTKEAQQTEKESNSSETQSLSSRSDLNLVFVCRSDLDPPTLCSHFPMLTCSVNAVCHPVTATSATTSGVVLIPLPTGSERLISEVLNVRRCSVVALNTTTLSNLGIKQSLLSLLARIQENAQTLKPLRASWLDAAADVALTHRENLMRDFSLPTSSSGSIAHVKMIQTTAPTNINQVKLEKKHSRDEKKLWRKNQRKTGHEKVITKIKQERNHARKEKVSLRRKVQEVAQKSKNKGPDKQEQKSGAADGVRDDSKLGKKSKPKRAAVTSSREVEMKDVP
ncbi:unnamed protein product [Sympodiomycopsis kandeliae]